MDVTVERQKSVLVARVNGRIDPKGAGSLETTITAALQDGDHTVILDFEQLAYIGNVGVRALRITARVLRDRDVRMAVCAPQGVVAAVFSGAAWTDLFRSTNPGPPRSRPFPSRRRPRAARCAARRPGSRRTGPLALSSAAS